MVVEGRDQPLNPQYKGADTRVRKLNQIPVIGKTYLRHFPVTRLFRRYNAYLGGRKATVSVVIP